MTRCWEENQTHEATVAAGMQTHTWSKNVLTSWSILTASPSPSLPQSSSPPRADIIWSLRSVKKTFLHGTICSWFLCKERFWKLINWIHYPQREYYFLQNSVKLWLKQQSNALISQTVFKYAFNHTMHLVNIKNS